MFLRAVIKLAPCIALTVATSLNSDYLNEITSAITDKAKNLMEVLDTARESYEKSVKERADVEAMYKRLEDIVGEYKSGSGPVTSTVTSTSTYFADMLMTAAREGEERLHDFMANLVPHAQESAIAYLEQAELEGRNPHLQYLFSVIQDRKVILMQALEQFIGGMTILDGEVPTVLVECQVKFNKDVSERLHMYMNKAKLTERAKQIPRIITAASATAEAESGELSNSVGNVEADIRRTAKLFFGEPDEDNLNARQKALEDACRAYKVGKGPESDSEIFIILSRIYNKEVELLDGMIFGQSMSVSYSHLRFVKMTELIAQIEAVTTKAQAELDNFRNQ